MCTKAHPTGWAFFVLFGAMEAMIAAQIFFLSSRWYMPRQARPYAERHIPKNVVKVKENCAKTLAFCPQMNYNTTTFARLAQLVERLLDVERVSGSSPLSRTNAFTQYLWYCVFIQMPALCLHRRGHLYKKQESVASANALVRLPLAKKRTDLGVVQHA